MSSTNPSEGTVVTAARPVWARARDRFTPPGLDAALFGLSALFAFVVAIASSIPLYRQWGQIAVGPYIAAAFIATWLTVRARRRPVLMARFVLTTAVIIGTAIIPMVFEVGWRFDVAPQALHVQPEVVVVERAAQAVAKGHDPYRAVVVDGHLEGKAPGLPNYEAFFPYLPAMTLYGLPSATSINARYTDARIFFVASTLVCVALALLYAPARSERRLRALQVAVALPWATLAMATGGDDLPIIGFLLVAMVLAQRRRPGWAGLVLGLVSAMKFTAWPLAALALFAARNKDGKRAPWPMAAGIAVVTVPLVAVTAIAGPRTFFANVVEFPLGLSGVASPAGSALPGHILVTWIPSLHRVFPVLAAVIGIGVLIRYLWRHPPQDAAKVCQVAGVVLLVAILLAPATRIGYLLYPLNLFVWSWMLSDGVGGPDDAILEGDESFKGVVAESAASPAQSPSDT